MHRDIKKTLEEYEALYKKHEGKRTMWGEFHASDILGIVNLDLEADRIGIILNSMRFGFVVGYKAHKREIRKLNKVKS